MTDYERTFENGATLLNQGDTKQALSCFLNAETIHMATHGKASAEVEQMLGICYRMLGHFDEATRRFGKAYELAENKAHKGRIMSDWAMVPLCQKRYSDARKCLDESLALLADGDNKIEYFTTMGFIGRLLWAKGDTKAAYSYFASADGVLRDHVPYELNNLVWWLKAAPLKELPGLTRRAFRLAHHAKNRGRQAEIIGIVVGRPFITLGSLPKRVLQKLARFKPKK